MLSQEISQNLSKLSTNLTYFVHFVHERPLNLVLSANWNVLIYIIRCLRGQTSTTFHKKIWLTMSRFTGNQEKKTPCHPPQPNSTSTTRSLRSTLDVVYTTTSTSRITITTKTTSTSTTITTTTKKQNNLKTIGL